ncbi:DUF2793 domain-containing protein [Novosphingobium sp.]|uniref:DUF2793 domain-containing protein n=1 Tax=Novosphingobium sp. TaxID=1874826 RepID=UPI0025CDA7B7|nr:DUF2793 domain-containing protein [Novosphingobium sp.]
MTLPIAFPSTTPRLAFPLLYVGQTQKEVTVNETFLSADFLIDSAIEGVISSPPTSPAVGSMWLVGAASSGAFAGKTDNLAGWTESGWRFFAPKDGMRVFDLSLSAFRLYRYGWTVAAAPVAPTGGQTVDVQVRQALASLIEALKSAGILS